MKTLYTGILCALMASCAIDQNGDPYVQTPKLSIPIPKTDSILWGYGVIGLSSPKIHEFLGNDKTR